MENKPEVSDATDALKSLTACSHLHQQPLSDIPHVMLKKERPGEPECRGVFRQPNPARDRLAGVIECDLLLSVPLLKPFQPAPEIHHVAPPNSFIPIRIDDIAQEVYSPFAWNNGHPNRIQLQLEMRRKKVPDLSENLPQFAPCFFLRDFSEDDSALRVVNGENKAIEKIGSTQDE